MCCKASSCVVKTIFKEGFTLDFYKTRAEVFFKLSYGKKVDPKNEVCTHSERSNFEGIIGHLRTLNSCIKMQVA